MNTAAAPQELEKLAERMIWWKRPEEALRYPDRLLAQVMALGTWEDVQTAKRVWTREQFVAVLKNAPTGVFDRRSWAYWHCILKVALVSAPPQRKIP